MKEYRGNHQAGEIELDREVIVFENRFMRLYNDEVIFPNGSRGFYLRTRWNAPYGVCVVPVSDKGEVLMIRNFRHEYRGWGWELPKGFGVHGSTPRQCAEKELREETGYTGTDWTFIKTVADAYENDGTHLFRVRVHPAAAGEAEMEAEEAIAGHAWFGREALEEMICSDAVRDPLTLVGLQIAFAWPPYLPA